MSQASQPSVSLLLSAKELEVAQLRERALSSLQDQVQPSG